MTGIRAATRSDVDAVVETVAAAFAHDSAWGFMLGAGNDSARRAFARTLLVPRVERGTAWVSDDCLAVAMWERVAPEDRVGDGEIWGAFRAEVGDDVWQRLQTYDEALEAVGPQRPYWYLGVLATHPDAQGRGLATAVLQPGFAAAAADGWDCWLETSTPANKPFYAGRGFEVVTEVAIDGGPPTWWLRRPHPST